MQAAWWKVEPDISDDILRGQHAIIAEADAAEWDRIEMARRRYPVSIGIDPAQPRTSGQWSQAIGQIKVSLVTGQWHIPRTIRPSD